MIRIPPLRERVSDIMLLAEHFAIAMCGELKRPYFSGFSPKAQQALEQYPWPGNIRELKNVVERSVYRHKDNDAPVETIIFDPFGEKLAALSNPEKIPEQKYHYPLCHVIYAFGSSKVKNNYLSKLYNRANLISVKPLSGYL